METFDGPLCNQDVTHQQLSSHMMHMLSIFLSLIAKPTFATRQPEKKIISIHGALDWTSSRTLQFHTIACMDPSMLCTSPTETVSYTGVFVPTCVAPRVAAIAESLLVHHSDCKKFG